MLGVCIVHQDKAIGNRHGDLAELVIRFCVIQTNGVVDARIVFVASDTALLLQFYERHAQVCTFQFGRPFYLVKCVAVHPIHQGVHPTAVSFDNFHVEHTLHVFSGYYFYGSPVS